MRLYNVYQNKRGWASKQVGRTGADGLGEQPRGASSVGVEEEAAAGFEPNTARRQVRDRIIAAVRVRASRKESRKFARYLTVHHGRPARAGVGVVIAEDKYAGQAEHGRGG